MQVQKTPSPYLGLIPKSQGPMIGNMNAPTPTYLNEVLSRLEGNREPKDRPQLLGCREEVCLLRSWNGLKEVSQLELPATVDLAPLIDHTLLKPTAWAADIDQLCDEARMHEFASVCVNPCWVSRCARRLGGSPVRVCTVVGFPLGGETSHSKAQSARDAFGEGAHEIDIVLNLGYVKGLDWELVKKELRIIREAVPEACLKVILETCLLTDNEKRQACRIAAEERYDFVKTSTGFSTGGATLHDIQLMREEVGDRCGVKASGGIRSYGQALDMVLAGATRLGLSSSLAVIKGMGKPGEGY